MDPDADLESDVGNLDVDSMVAVRDAFVGLDGLVDRERTGLDSVIDPTVLRIGLEDGIGDAEWCRFDVKWYRTSHYNVHHVDDAGVNYRYDYHPKAGADDRHFHPPPDAPSTDVEPSCIGVETPTLVARAVHKLWRRAYRSGSLAGLDEAANPP